jgi:DNA-3-methyladenine glycosylase
MNLGSPLPRSFFARPTVEVARDLIGKIMLVEGVGGIINETEAYPPGDPAAHSFAGKTLRNAALFAEPGTIYVYRSYGIHFCVNVSCEAEGIGGGVLFRGIIPFTESIPLLQMRRGTKIKPEQLCNGPGKLTQALGITLHDNFSDSCGSGRIRLFDAEVEAADIRATPRIGISKNTDQCWRFIATLID